MDWNEAKLNSNKLTNAIESLLEKEQPKNIADVLKTVKEIDKDCGALPNPNHEGKYCQLILYPSAKMEYLGRNINVYFKI